MPLSGDQVRYEISRVPNAVDPIEIPVGYADLNGDGSEYALKVAGATGGGGGAAGLSQGTPTTTTYSVDDTGTVQLAASNASRKSLLIINDSDVDSIWIKGGGSAPTAASGSIRIQPGASFDTDRTTAAYLGIAETGKTVSVTVEVIA